MASGELWAAAGDSRERGAGSGEQGGRGERDVIDAGEIGPKRRKKRCPGSWLALALPLEERGERGAGSGLEQGAGSEERGECRKLKAKGAKKERKAEPEPEAEGWEEYMPGPSSSASGVYRERAHIPKAERVPAAMSLVEMAYTGYWKCKSPCYHIQAESAGSACLNCGREMVWEPAVPK